MNLLHYLAEVALRSSLVLSLVFALLLILPRASAAERHLVVLLGLIVVALLPAGILLLPRLTWIVPLPAPKVAEAFPSSVPAAAPEISPSHTFSLAPAAPSAPALLTPGNILSLLLLFGMLLQAALLARATRHWRNLQRAAQPAPLAAEILVAARIFCPNGELPPVFISDQIRVPVLVGCLRPVILLPRAALTESASRLTMMLCHELAHFRRGDMRVLPLLALLRIVYWWHPLVWLALARLRRERENACDDLVLAHRFQPSDYADLILHAARAWRSNPLAAFSALAMASSSAVGERVTAILHPSRRRASLGRVTISLALALGFALGWPLVATEIRAEVSTPVLNSAPGQRWIQVGFRLISFDEKTYAEKRSAIDAAVEKDDVAFFHKLPGTSLLSSPTVTTRAGQKADLDMTQTMSFPLQFDRDSQGKLNPSHFTSRQTGVEFEALPTLLADGKTMRLAFKNTLTEFAGWVPLPGGGREPLFNVRRLDTSLFMTRPEVAVWLGTSNPWSPTPPPGHSTSRRTLLFIDAYPVPAH